jgi:hypothetical protein
MRIPSILFLAVIIFTACSQRTDVADQPSSELDSTTSYELPLPKDWSSEKFAIPMTFAPGIPFTGVEEVRFHPDWGDATKDGYWAYSFMWFVKEQDIPPLDTLEKYLDLYYTGIAKVNTPDSILLVADTSAKAALREVSAGDTLTTFEGHASVFDFMARNRLTLNIRLNIRRCNESVAYLFEISPQGRDHTVWSQLQGLTSGFRCGKDPNQ